ncbi:HEAT repeat domain-containing protein [Leptotrichia sp. oral taxon 879]|uniref:HEAT repeat domain-containing protein n=1 Tax=Leptotrichia sp. oral taxon 879 TaxID=1227267 RepID=UPI0003ADE5E3|nr:HEAT repeat domain-containing protein [Leptotrichia sp. oral taxon 879]ERK49341.1 hypothetical protein HMPREF1552_01757 [Leptotrichia sp. oral taxon 879 str. F0557]
MEKISLEELENLMWKKYKKQISFQQLQKEFLKNDDERIEYIKTELEKAYNEKNGDSVYILCKLTKEEWHGKHEDIVFYLQQLELPSTIDCIYELAVSNFEKYSWDDNFALVRKCCFALGDINTPKVKEKLESLLQSDEEMIRKHAMEQLERYNFSD